MITNKVKHSGRVPDLIYYRDDVLTAKQISDKYSIPISSVRYSLTVGKKLKEHAIYVVKKSPIEEKTEVMKMIKLLDEERLALNRKLNAVEVLLEIYKEDFKKYTI